MFAPSFPAAPVFVMINLIINLRFSIYNYQNVMKREINLPADSIGIWLDIFSIMAYAATFMNCLVIYTVNYEQMSKLTGINQGFGLAIVLVMSEHIMFFIKFVL
jgi:Calcium-activated chloride channel